MGVVSSDHHSRLHARPLSAYSACMVPAANRRLASRQADSHHLACYLHCTYLWLAAQAGQPQVGPTYCPASPPAQPQLHLSNPRAAEPPLCSLGRKGPLATPCPSPAPTSMDRHLGKTCMNSP